jgi:uncharacterized coiled-coil DUF342 family protein
MLDTETLERIRGTHARDEARLGQHGTSPAHEDRGKLLEEVDTLRTKLRAVKKRIEALADDALPHAVDGHSTARTRLIDELVREVE